MMGHRHLFSTTQTLDPEYQNLDHIHGRGRLPENRALTCPIENVDTEVINMSSSWNFVLRPRECSSSHVTMELPHNQIDMSGPSYNPFPQTPYSMSFYPAQNYANHPYSSSHYQHQHVMHGVEGRNIRMNNGSRSSKRKMPAIPMVHESFSSTSRNSSAGGSLDHYIPSMEKPTSGLQHSPWETVRTATRYGGGNLSVTEGGLQRNVRSRSALNLDINRTSTGNPFHHLYSGGGVTHHSGTVGLSNRSAGISQLIHNSVSSAAQQRILSSDANISLEIGQYRFDQVSGSSAVNPPYNLHSWSIQATRGPQSGHSQTLVHSHRAMSSYQNMRHLMDSSDSSLHPVRTVYNSGHSRHQSLMGWLHSERGRQSVVPYERFRPLAEVDAHNRLATEGVVMLDHSLSHSSRSSPDQHRDMMLDVDSMTYEELLALGERIGNVSTGLSEDLILKCLVKNIHHPSLDQMEAETCVICLEEYMDRDMIGKVANCGHSYHMSCIKKWLSMKNVCPLCKAPALSNSLKK